MSKVKALRAGGANGDRMRAGFHISIAGGLHKVVPRARQLGCETIQLFSRSPRSFRARPIDEQAAAQMRCDTRVAGVRPVFLHAPYVVNLGASDPRLWGASVRILREELRRAALLGASYVLVHPGRWGRSTPEDALWKVVEGLTTALRARPEGVQLAVENTAGQKGEIGSSLEELALLVEAVAPEGLGVMLDVAHLFQAGYEIDQAEGLDQTLSKAEELLGLHRIVGLHMNDSRTPRGSHVDRHWHLGHGRIGVRGLGRIVRHPRLRHLPAIMETPRAGIDDDLRNMRVMRSLRGDRVDEPD
jgi:deoxyribonuclease-4